jgi:hypothetical protein
MKQQLNEMKSLIARMENPRTGWGQVLNESKQIVATDLINFLSTVQIQEGQFVRLGYIQLYTIPGQYPNEDLYNKMNAIAGDFGVENDMDYAMVSEDVTDRARQRYIDFMDKSKNSEWDNPTGRLYKGQRAFNKAIYKYIIKLTKYRLHWQGQTGYAKAQERNTQAYNDMTAKIDPKYYDELGIQYKDVDADGNEVWHNTPQRPGPSYKFIGEPANFGVATDTEWKGDNETGEYVPRNIKYRTNAEDPSTQVEIPGYSIRNMLSKVEDQEAIFFGVTEEGDIDRIPDSLGRMLYKVSDSYAAKLQDVSLQDDPDKLAQFKMFYDFKKEENMKQKIFKLSNVAYLCATGLDIRTKQKDSFFWVNNEPLFLLERTINKEKVQYTATINVGELEAILKQEASKEADGLAAFEE